MRLSRRPDPRRERIARLRTALWSPKIETRKEAVHALGKLSGPLAVQTLSRALMDANETVRYAAVDALGANGSIQALSALGQALHKKDKGWTHRHTALTLASHANPHALVALDRHFGRLDAPTREDVLDALDKNKDVRPDAFLCKRLHDKERSIRIKAIQKVLARENPDTYLTVARTTLPANASPDEMDLFDSDRYTSFIFAPKHPAFIPALVEFVARVPTPDRHAATLSLYERLTGAGPNHPFVKPVWRWMPTLFTKDGKTRLDPQGTARAILHLQREGANAFKNVSQLRLFIKQAVTKHAK